MQVLPEELIRRMAERTHKREQCPMPTGPWSSSCGDLPRCSIAGNGSCVLQCEEVKLGPLPVLLPVRCDLRDCHNLSMSATHTSFLCPDGRRCGA